MADAGDLKSPVLWACGFESRFQHHIVLHLRTQKERLMIQALLLFFLEYSEAGLSYSFHIQSNRLFRTTQYTCHTVRTMLLPIRCPIVHMNIAKQANAYTSAARNTGVSNMIGSSESSEIYVAMRPTAVHVSQNPNAKIMTILDTYNSLLVVEEYDEFYCVLLPAEVGYVVKE